MADNNVTMVQASYTDVNNALENLVGNITAGNSNNANYVTQSQLTQAIANVSSGTGTNPIGTILPFGTSTIPNGYLLCNGASYDTTKYADLHTAIGSSSVPDLRGMFLRGLDPTGNVDIDGATRALLSFQDGSVLPADSANGWFMGWTNYNNQGSVTNNETLGYDKPVASTLSTISNLDISFGNGGAYKVGTNQGNAGIARPKNVAVNYIIKAAA